MTRTTTWSYSSGIASAGGHTRVTSDSNSPAGVVNAALKGPSASPRNTAADATAIAARMMAITPKTMI
ncbi:hypothetical protein [Demequina litorisediminis]|uniref:hypothetical protein n=1 Tax=Demequina litorisediminis TaxID=1849022 RepID=UPI003D672DA8